MALSFNLTFNDLYHDLERVDRLFLEMLSDGSLKDLLMDARLRSEEFTAESDLIITLAPHVAHFIGTLFGINEALAAHREKTENMLILVKAKRLFVHRYALKKYDATVCFDEINLSLVPQTEDTFAAAVLAWLTDETTYARHLDHAARYAAWATLTPEGKEKHSKGILFKIPHKTDPTCLIPGLEKSEAGAWQLSYEKWRARYGFLLTDQGPTIQQAIDQANYCIWCHKQGKDSCSKGMPSKLPNERFQKNAFGAFLTGCPLEEKISEMNLLRSQGNVIGALATIMIDNPMVAATGHRICNECMKACIYQKQEPVNIPEVETQTLRSVLELPFGFEIYSLLSRWNPLNIHRPFPKPFTGKRVLVAGMGPAGFTLSHHLLNEGHAVVGIDGLKIEPLPSLLLEKPIEFIDDLIEPLDARINWGFGGVAEYGITVRWDKNYLKIIRLLLEKRSHFLLKGGVRFGGALTLSQSFEIGFDHVALCLGAGKPTLLDMENNLAPGVRQASDFLMALQLTGAAKKETIANLQVRLPILVIGGGLTAIDTATEALAYYAQQVEKFLVRYETLVKSYGEAVVRQVWTAFESHIADEMITHARALRMCGSEKEKQKLLVAWGGATVVYRRALTEAPSYQMNHEEVAKALEEGITFLDNAVPCGVKVDETGAAVALRVRQGEKELMIKGCTILVAAGTKPNTALQFDTPEEISIADTGFFEAIDEEGQVVSPERMSKPDAAHVLMRKLPNGKAVSFFGDLHPSFAGNVVKAMASAKRGYPVISRCLEATPMRSLAEIAPFLEKIKNDLQATVYKVIRLTPTIVEVVIHSPLAAQAFQPGQFYRLQNYETQAIKHQGTTFAMEGLALTGAHVDKEKGLLSLIVLEMGGSSNLCALLQPGEPVVLMGPTGTPTHIPHQETVLLIGGGLGNAVLFSIGQAMRAKNCRVLYVAGYKKSNDRYKVEAIEQAADSIIWCCDEAPGFIPTRATDKAFVGNIVEALAAYHAGELGEQPIALSEIDRIIAIGSDRMMAAVAAARHGKLSLCFKQDVNAIGSINSPMQCMMKEICGQCLQKHKDPHTGLETIVFSCTNQDQNLETVDFSSLNGRLAQNSLQEKLTALWLKHMLTMNFPNPLH